MQNDKRVTRSITTASVMGLHFISGMLVGSFLGYGIDRWFNSYPICMSLGFFLGIISGFYNVWKDTKKLLKESEDE